jgi:hypothetical protein
VDVNGRWQALRRDGKFLFPVKAMSKVFRGKYCHLLQSKSPDTYRSLRAELWKKPWVVYAKRPFGSPSSVVEYLGRYTHKVAISHHRLREVGDSEVVIDYKDYRQGGMKKQMRLRHAYSSQALCQDKALRYIEQYVEAGEVGRVAIPDDGRPARAKAGRGKAIAAL